MKFSRGVGPSEARSDLDVHLVGHESAADFSSAAAEGCDRPEWAMPLAVNVVGRPGWSCYVAYDGAQPAGAGALFVDDEVGWLFFFSSRRRHTRCLSDWSSDVCSSD